MTAGFSPTAESPSDCALFVSSDDPVHPDVRVALYAWSTGVDTGSPMVDDDHGGYAEVDDDCDDTDATTGPGAQAWCDGIDNDCDGLKDSADACTWTSSSPGLVGEGGQPLRPGRG